ncbi:DUF3892 domain-containing protein [Bacillus sp. 2205SS5-2]|uniref:DUF3892 domain-containing protein n=1 Tax=Bacillus sp. 2205SS5-2 TaxID=3109031 RepID=UPI0030057FB4
MEYIERVHRTQDGTILSFQTSTGRIISYRKAVQAVKNGEISGMMVHEYNDDYEQLSSAIDGDATFDSYPDIF